MRIGAIVRRSRDWGRAQFASLTSGQRWTSALALGLAVVMLVAGMPSNVRVVAAPPPIVAPPPPAVVDVPPPAIPFVPPATSVAPRAPVRRPKEPPREPSFTPPVPPLHGCATDELLPAPVFASLVEQLTPVQAAYEEATGQPLGVDLVSVAAFIGQCTDALPNAPALITLSVLLNQVYDALEAAGMPPIDFPEPPVVSLPDVPVPLLPVVEALAPTVVPVCTGIDPLGFGVAVGVGSALALAPIANGLLPFPTSEVLPYLWPVRAVCAIFIANAPEPETAAAVKPGATL